ncbi:hypothetical protein C7I36_09760 [Zobellella taiwanensis]|uniref:Uncharacterized protein n=1 Tax=Zobellella taiwanensis TaxID=347535 RepID=A0A2P7QX64_9GAMM|nr:hypothetical protein [Zobellella taiwanensis]PSJ42555.1 hypothetical protein C7I36_09760 [Zobellella taiwanensis]
MSVARSGALVLPGFMKPEAVAQVKQEGLDKQHLAYYTASRHNVYLAQPDPAFAEDHQRNLTVVSSKGCITTTQLHQAAGVVSVADGEYDIEVSMDTIVLAVLLMIGLSLARVPVVIAQVL